jgi:hypothetical protein
MKIPIADYAFDGPHKSTGKLEDKPGVFAVISEFHGKHYLLDVDHADDVRRAIRNHERRKCWEKYRKGLIRYAVFYTNKPAVEMDALEARIRKTYENIPCGGCFYE